MTEETGVDEVLAALQAHRWDWSWTCEAELQEQVLSALPEDLVIARECELAHRDRPDFMVECVALEVKVAGSLAELTRQVHRYAQHPEVGAVIVVSTRTKHRCLPKEINGKPCRVCYLNPLA